jgi:hypothetical protein
VPHIEANAVNLHIFLLHQIAIKYRKLDVNARGTEERTSMITTLTVDREREKTSSHNFIKSINRISNEKQQIFSGNTRIACFICYCTTLRDFLCRIMQKELEFCFWNVGEMNGQIEWKIQ